MKYPLSLIASFAIVSYAGPVKFGADASVGYNILSLGDSLNSKSQASFGFAIGPQATFFINDQIGINGGLSFLYDMNSVKAKDADAEGSLSKRSLGFKIAPVYQINEQFGLKLGYEWDMPLGGTESYKSGNESVDFDVVWAPDKGTDLGKKEIPYVSVHNILFGASYAIMPQLDITLQGKFALNGPRAEYEVDKGTGKIGSLKGAAASENNFSVHQIAIGMSYSFN